MKTYFYIIQRNNLMYEIEFTPDRFSHCLELWQKGGLIVFPTIGAGINSADVANILNADQYKNFIETAPIKSYVLNGSWYEISNKNKPIRHEPWKQKEIDERNALDIGKEQDYTKRTGASGLSIQEIIARTRAELTERGVLTRQVKNPPD